jgi:polyphenol oxidase
VTPDPLRSSALPVAHGFFTREGGISAGPFASLNCSLSSRDSAEAVLQNRARAAQALGADPAALVGLTQVHGAVAVRVREPWAPGAGARADAMVTDRPGIALGVITADCAPVLLVDGAAGIIGAAHAGWRGAAGGIIEATVAAMSAIGAEPGRIAAAVGPCIAQASYEVGPDLHAAVLCASPDAGRYFIAGGRADRWRFDLSGYCAHRLAAADITCIDRLDCDTLADETRFFSHRRRTLTGGGPIGHQISIISLVK